MNNFAKIPAVVLGGMLAACAQAPMTPAGGDTDPEFACRDRTVTVFQSTGFLAVYPEYIDVCSGYDILVKPVPPVRTGNVRTAPGGRGEPGWLGGVPGDKAGAGGAVIRVPPGTSPGVYKYSITVDGVGTLDPRARVVR